MSCIFIIIVIILFVYAFFFFIFIVYFNVGIKNTAGDASCQPNKDDPTTTKKVRSSLSNLVPSGAYDIFHDDSETGISHFE